MRKNSYIIFIIIIFFHGTNTINADEVKSVVKKDINIEISGGISGGNYLSISINKQSKNSYNNIYTVSNFLLVFNVKKNNIPLSIESGIGNSLASTTMEISSEILPSLNIQFVDFIFSISDNINFETGLLQPNSGYEDTYTYNNQHSTVAILASQQPFNAMGIRTNISLKKFGLFGGFYKNRLDTQEYSFGTTLPSVSYELGLKGRITGINFTLYHYHINNIRNLTGVVIEKKITNSTFLALNIDCWKWSSDIKQMKGRYSTGVTLYISRFFGKYIEIPVRAEYINQKLSKIYTDSKKSTVIYGLTITPTYHFTDKIYIRIEGGLVNSINNRLFSSVETGIKF